MNPKSWSFDFTVPKAADYDDGWPGGAVGMGMVNLWWCQVNPGYQGNNIPHSSFAGWFLRRLEWRRTYAGSVFTQSVFLFMQKTDGTTQTVEVPYPRDAHFYGSLANVYGYPGDGNAGPFGTGFAALEMKHWGPAPYVSLDPLPDASGPGLGVNAIALQLYDEMRILREKVTRVGAGVQGLKVGAIAGGRAILRPGKGGLSLKAGSQIAPGVGYHRGLVGERQVISRKKVASGSAVETVFRVFTVGYSTVKDVNGDIVSEGWGIPSVTDFQQSIEISKVAVLRDQTTNAVTTLALAGKYQVTFDVIRTVFSEYPRPGVPPEWELFDSRKSYEFLPEYFYSSTIDLDAPGLAPDPGDYDTWPFVTCSVILTNTLVGTVSPFTVTEHHITNLAAEWVL